jgi:hypothetical protein
MVSNDKPSLGNYMGQDTEDKEDRVGFRVFLAIIM